MADYNPRQEVLDFVRDIYRSARPDRAALAQLFAGNERVSHARILRGMREGTPLGKQAYAVMEMAYDTFQALERGEPLDPGKLGEMIKQYVDSRKPQGSAQSRS
tara:strand:- start:77 stop:388 length:312 start_codon:yes stop_codon:yes gene_type:complete